MKKKFIVPYMLAGAATFVGGLHFTESIASPINSEGQSYTIKSYEKLDNSSDSVLNVEEWAYTEPYAIKTIERKSDVLYIMSTGDTICRTGGTRAWRNNNPGNLAYGQFARAKGAIGKGGKFAVFPDYETGRKALEDLLLSDSYKNMTIASAIIKYAPPYENDVERYKRQLRRLTGVALDKKLCDLDSAEMKKITGAICVIEGWREGKIKGNTNNATMLASARTKAMMDTMQNCM